MTSNVTAAELLSGDTAHAEPLSSEWWDDPRQDAESAERICKACRGRGITRWDEDCPDCGGLGVLFD
jgi:RecJ-like exonuclease